ncbi:MAG: glutaminase A [Microbacterium sp. SCN 70-27]|uniref:glutaminase A n=1 Tax=unclassified Microbacterium TaxID=2609290 RepID=UPI000869EB7F|nr:MULTISPECIES: glutaminase A [unclassified Microbacterium]MBN9225486.1 glutaminase A [Microbacterium sp.]ODT27405.1 MAG: glutaminase A [Microbacterium sp. SCN 70-27]
MDPIRGMLATLLDTVRDHDAGAVADYIPELASAAPDPLALAVVGPRGQAIGVGDAEVAFTIQSISKPFVFALALEERGRDDVLRYVGVEPSGEPFNAISLEAGTGRPANPLINAGAIAATGLVGDADPLTRSARIRAGLSRFAGRELAVDEAVYASEAATGERNRALAHLLRSYGLVSGSAHDVVEAYFRQCATLVTVRDLAVMAGTLAFGGRNPVTGEQVVSERTARDVSAVMTSCGMYDASGSWLMRVGLPTKSGVSGGLLALSPSQFGVGVFSPRLDSFGNSHRGQLVLERLSETLGLHVFEQHESIALPAISVDRGEDGVVRLALEGELSFSGAEHLLSALRSLERVDRDAEVVVDLTGLTRVHPAALEAIRDELAVRGGHIRVDSPA